ncbi:MAG TPA: hypothetical protein DHV88_09130, partial [Roseburia sp.]|nr:hypothetical protein [Roseburia sp.]
AKLRVFERHIND